ncbi:hypothetical protein [Nonomuraea candida]|uniref:hypothetical protein n=1 Tax=Nonomuraea candida TaxID=359159 RepID=UPI0012FC758A|nr:hypothetical protein [Nonomuraea candida]
MSLPLAVGAVTSGWAGLGWGALAAGLCGGVPAVVIFGGVRKGWFGDWHIGERSQRPKLVAVIVALVVLALALLAALGAPRVMVACVTIMLATLAVVGPITLRWKISFHTAVAAGSVVMLAWVLPWPAVVLAAGALVVARVGGAGAEVLPHTPPPGFTSTSIPVRIRNDVRAGSGSTNASILTCNALRQEQQGRSAPEGGTLRGGFSALESNHCADYYSGLTNKGLDRATGRDPVRNTPDLRGGHALSTC